MLGVGQLRRRVRFQCERRQSSGADRRQWRGNVTMVRVDKHNALDQACSRLDECRRATRRRQFGSRGSAARRGKSFCSGLDVASFMSGRGGTVFCWSATATGWPTSLSGWPTTGPWCGPGHRAVRGIASAAVCRSRWAPTSGSRRRTRSCPSWRSSGASFPTWHHADTPSPGTY